MIPLYLTETFRGKFLHFVEVLLSLAMIRAVAAAFIFVWSQFLTGFMTQTFHGDYSIAMWLANLIPFTTIFVAFILNMFLIPSVTQMIFGGGAGLAGKLGEVVSREDRCTPCGFRSLKRPQCFSTSEIATSPKASGSLGKILIALARASSLSFISTIVRVYKATHATQERNSQCPHTSQSPVAP